MMLVDAVLAKRQSEGRPIRVGMIGAGFMGRRVATVSNRNIDGAIRAYREAGVEDPAFADSAADVARAVAANRPVVTNGPSAVCAADGIDVIFDVTGAVEFGAAVMLAAFEAGKHVVTMNAELDGTVGPLLARRARAAGLVFSGVDGDQPGVEMNLHRFVTGIGFAPDGDG
jgi:predicted homoserine dehydrogenase-like protein